MTFGYCFKSQISSSFFTKIISPTLNLSKIVFLLGIAHLSFFKKIFPSKPFKVWAGDKEYAYTKPKVVSLLHGQKDFNNGHKNVVAVCSDGDIVLRQDLDKIDPLIYCHSEVLEGEYE